MLSLSQELFYGLQLDPNLCRRKRSVCHRNSVELLVASHSVAQPVICSLWVSYLITNLAYSVQHAAATCSAVVLFALGPLLIIL